MRSKIKLCLSIVTGCFPGDFFKYLVKEFDIVKTGLHGDAGDLHVGIPQQAASFIDTELLYIIAEICAGHIFK